MRPPPGTALRPHARVLRRVPRRARLPPARSLRGLDATDGVSKTREFGDLLVHPELLGVVREVLGPGACFLQHTDLHVGSAVNWHRDSVNRRLGEGGDWDESEEPYRLARVGFYLQSHAESRFALGLVPGSHRRGGALDERGLVEVERVEQVGHAQWGFTIPKMPRIDFLHHRELLGALSLAACQTVKELMAARGDAAVARLPPRCRLRPAGAGPMPGWRRESISCAASAPP